MTFFQIEKRCFLCFKHFQSQKLVTKKVKEAKVTKFSSRLWHIPQAKSYVVVVIYHLNVTLQVDNQRQADFELYSLNEFFVAYSKNFNSPTDFSIWWKSLWYIYRMVGKNCEMQKIRVQMPIMQYAFVTPNVNII